MKIQLPDTDGGFQEHIRLGCKNYPFFTVRFPLLTGKSGV